MSKIIEQEVIIKGASPEDVYTALMDSAKHAEFTGAPAEIDNKVGGQFTVYGDYAEGENIELLPGKKIVQKWRGTDWPEGHYSTATFALSKTEDGTKLKFTQTNVPDENCEDIESGWHEYYWEPLNEYFAS